jgi:hypothetical protein
MICEYTNRPCDCPICEHKKEINVEMNLWEKFILHLLVFMGGMAIGALASAFIITCVMAYKPI